MAPRYRITLTHDQRVMLEEMSSTGIRSAKIVLHARALLLLDAGEHGTKWSVAHVADALGMTTRTLEHLKKRYVEDGLDQALQRKEREAPPRPVAFGGEFEAKLLRLACSESPDGHARWTVRLLAAKLVELQIVPKVSPTTVCGTLKKMNLSLT